MIEVDSFTIRYVGRQDRVEEIERLLLPQMVDTERFKYETEKSQLPNGKCEVVIICSGDPLVVEKKFLEEHTLIQKYKLALRIRGVKVSLTKTD